MTEAEKWIVRIERAGAVEYKGHWASLAEGNAWADEHLDDDETVTGFEFGVFTPAASLHTTSEQWAAEFGSAVSA